MRLGIALLADSAVAHTDGKLYIMGAGIDRVYAEALPVLLPQLCVALKLYFDDSEPHRPHVLETFATAPDGRIAVPLSACAFTPQAAPPGKETPVPLVLFLRDLRLEHAGRYEFIAHLDQRELTHLPLTIVNEQPAPAGVAAPPRDPIFDALSEGYRQFTAGDVAGAGELFQRVAERFPLSAAAHNNLGFARLAQGTTDGALVSFNRALELGFRPPQLAHANMGTALYVLGEPQRAEEHFISGLRLGLASAPTTLFVITARGLTAIQLHTPGDFVALLSLNLGWCTLSLGRREDARAHANAATSGLLTFPEGSSSITFRTALEELLARLDG
jgi:hypothetical protein